MPKENQDITIYTIVYTAADADSGRFHNLEARGSCLSLASAQAELERQIATEKAGLDRRYDCEERDGDACFSRIEILTNCLHCEGGLGCQLRNAIRWWWHTCGASTVLFGRTTA